MDRVKMIITEGAKKGLALSSGIRQIIFEYMKNNNLI